MVAAEPSDYTRLEQAHYDAIKSLELTVRDCEYREELAKRAHKLAKNELDAVILKLRATIHDGPDPQGTLPGMGQKEMDRSAGPRWRTMPISLAIHSSEIVKSLAESGIETIGQLADFTASGKSLTSLNGIGEMSEAKIIEQMQLFWKENPGYVPDEDKPDAV